MLSATQRITFLEFGKSEACIESLPESTFRDLGPEREAALLALRRRHQTIIAMEDLAGPAPTLETALEHLRESDVVLLVLGI